VRDFPKMRFLGSESFRPLSYPPAPGISFLACCRCWPITARLRLLRALHLLFSFSGPSFFLFTPRYTASEGFLPGPEHCRVSVFPARAIPAEVFVHFDVSFQVNLPAPILSWRGSALSVAPIGPLGGEDGQARSRPCFFFFTVMPAFGKQS